MKFSFLGVAGAVALLSAAPVGPARGQGLPTPLKYPVAARGAQSDDLNGVLVADPYRWLENVNGAEARKWVESENELTESYLAGTSRRREVQGFVASAWAYPTLSAPFSGGDRLFFFENSGVENGAPLYVRDRAGAIPRVLIDPSTFSRDGSVAIVDQAASPDGKYLAYAVSAQGSGWHRVRVRDVKSSQDSDDNLDGIRVDGLAWTQDERGFFYVRTEQPPAGDGTPSLAPFGRQRVFYHYVGKPQSNDRLMFENPDHPSWGLTAKVTDDGQYLIIAMRHGTESANRVDLIDLDNPKHPNLAAPLVKLFDTGDALYDVAANSGPIFFVRTTKNAPRARLVAVDINTPDENHWTNVLRETYDPLVEVRRVDDRLVAHRIHDARSVLELYALDGGPRGTVALPGVGTVGQISPRGDNREFYFAYSSFLQPTTIYRYDLDARVVVVQREAFPDSSLTRFETTQLFFTSADGTRVPMFITAKRGITLNGTHPTLLAGYGAFDQSMTPSFSPSATAWLKLGGIYAVANVRGGGEYGRAWHEAATGAKKHVSIDDFISAAEFLIGQRYTRPASLAIGGTGAGGLLAAAALARRPDLFGAALIANGLLDMTRFPRFTVGATWIPEFGSPDRPQELHALLGYSPLQNLRPGTRYPATLLTIGDHDDIVTPVHSYKFVATLQWLQSIQPADSPWPPALIRVERDAGPGGRSARTKEVARDADRLAFLIAALGVGR